MPSLLAAVRAYAEARGLTLRDAYRRLVAAGLQVTDARRKGAQTTNGQLDAYARRQNAVNAARARWDTERKLCAALGPNWREIMAERTLDGR